jgi:hypothetical protein
MGPFMDGLKIDQESMMQLAKTLTFICGADNPCVVALKAAATSGAAKDIKQARALFLKLKPSDRQAALTMLKG